MQLSLWSLTLATRLQNSMKGYGKDFNITLDSIIRSKVLTSNSYIWSYILSNDRANYGRRCHVSPPDNWVGEKFKPNGQSIMRQHCQHARWRHYP